VDVCGGQFSIAAGLTDPGGRLRLGPIRRATFCIIREALKAEACQSPWSQWETISDLQWRLLLITHRQPSVDLASGNARLLERRDSVCHPRRLRGADSPR